MHMSLTKRYFRSLKRARHRLSGVICLSIVVLLFGGLAVKMGAANMLNTVMHTAHDLLLNTCFFLMAVCVVTGAIGRLFVEFGVVELLEKGLRPLMKPLFNLPGMASLGAVLTFLSDNPAIITLSQDKRFASHFKKYQFISLTNFGTAFGMGLIVIIFMMGYGFFKEPLIGLIGAIFGCMVSTRLMQYFVKKSHPEYADEPACELTEEDLKVEHEEYKSLFLRVLNSLLDGGRTGVDVGLAIIPGVIIISSLVMILTFSASADGTYTGAAYEGVAVLPWLGEKIGFIFQWLCAALGLVPKFIQEGWVDGNAIAVFTAIGMCWSGFLSTHTAMLDSMHYRELTSRAILSHTIGGLFAAIVAHWVYVLVMMLF